MILYGYFYLVHRDATLLWRYPGYDRFCPGTLLEVLLAFCRSVIPRGKLFRFFTFFSSNSYKWISHQINQAWFRLLLDGRINHRDVSGIRLQAVMLSHVPLSVAMLKVTKARIWKWEISDMFTVDFFMFTVHYRVRFNGIRATHLRIVHVPRMGQCSRLAHSRFQCSYDPWDGRVQNPHDPRNLSTGKMLKTNKDVKGKF